MTPLRKAIRPTTIIESVKLRDRLGFGVTIASETFQHTGSFKFRAAYNLSLNVPNDEIFTASSGNFGQALAYSCKLLGKKCTVVMPVTSAQVKVDAVRSFGATVDLIDVKQVGRGQRIAELSAEMPNAYFASAYDDQLVVDGNASLGEDLAAMNFDAIIVPVGGGGLISGILQGLRSKGSKTLVYGAEPAIANDAARSLRSGGLVANESEPVTLADGARTLSLGKLNWEIIRTGVADIFEVTETEIAEAVRLYFTFANLKSEPTGGLPLGSLLSRYEQFAGQRLCVIVSGANVDASVYMEILRKEQMTAKQ